MATPSGLPKVGEFWMTTGLDGSINPPVRVRIIRRSDNGSGYSLHVELLDDIPGRNEQAGHRFNMLTAAYWIQTGHLWQMTATQEGSIMTPTEQIEAALDPLFYKATQDEILEWWQRIINVAEDNIIRMRMEDQ